jgi:hypothetical protein
MKRVLLVAMLTIGWMSSASANSANEQLLSMTENQRQTAMTNFLKQSGERCNVTKTFFQGKTKSGDALWSLQCEKGNAWSLVIKNDRDGSTKLTPCSVLKAVGGGECFKKY